MYSVLCIPRSPKMGRIGVWISIVTPQSPIVFIYLFDDIFYKKKKGEGRKKGKKTNEK
jgi:hypothetical protein